MDALIRVVAIALLLLLNVHHIFNDLLVKFS